MARLIKNGGELVIPLLKAVNLAADAFGPLQGPTGGALRILELVKKFKTNHKEWLAFGDYVADTLACVIYFLPEVGEGPETVLNSLNSLRTALDDIRYDIERLQKRSRITRLACSVKDPETINNLRRKLDDASKLYLLKHSMCTGIEVHQLFGSINAHIAGVQERLSNLENNIVKHVEHFSLTAKEIAILNLLPYAKETSWNPDRVCLPHTRQSLLEEIWSWINDPKSSRIFLLSGVAGSGKTAIAHSVAQRCADHSLPIVLSSFFFTLDKPERNSQLISTIATDLLKINGRFAAMVASAIEDDRSLLYAPVSRQFEKLILDPSRLHPPSQPVVIVIDALDEGYNEDLLKLLRTKFHLLPETFRIFLTSRSDMKIDSSLHLTESIHRRCIDLYTDMNAEDIVLYSRHRLEEVAQRRKLENGWPEKKLLADFTRKADGLFLWVATVVNFIGSRLDPIGELHRLLYDPNTHLGVEDTIGKLYLEILERCNWRDRTFTEGYGMLVGAILAAKAPLSIRAWQSLHSDVLKVPVKDILISVGSLFSGLDQNDKPIRILHQSFRDFSTSPHQHTATSSSFYTNIDVSGHSERLALLCLIALNKGLAAGILGLGFLKAESDKTGIPSIVADTVPEGLRYASSYWIDHVIHVDTPTPTLVQALREFLQLHLIAWIELSATIGKFRNLAEFWAWRRTHASSTLESSTTFLTADRCSEIQKLSSRFSEVNRREDALTAMEEVVLAYRELVYEDQSTFKPELAQSLHSLAKCLFSLGRRGEALDASHQAVALRRVLVTEHGSKFNSALAKSLHNLSVHLFELGRREKAVEAVREAVALHQGLAGENPKEFSVELAWPLHDLSVYLSDLGRREEAVEVVQKVVTLHREIARENPEKFNPDLAWSLHSLSAYLFDLGRSEDAANVAQEVVAIRRALAGKDPKKFDPHLAWSLHRLSLYLSDLGRCEEALEVAQEAVALHREIFSEYPKTFNSELAASLHCLSACLSDLGRREEALEMVYESYALRRVLADEYPQKFNPDLAESLQGLSQHLFGFGRHEEAVVMAQESVTLYRALAGKHPQKYQPALVKSLHHLAVHLISVNQLDEAAEKAQEALTLRRAPSSEFPKNFDSQLASSLCHFSIAPPNLGQGEVATNSK